MPTTAKPNIGFIGLGVMGSAMVGRLQDLDYSLTVLANRNRAPVEAAKSRGALEASSARALAAENDVVMLCMDTSKSVEAPMFGPEGILEGIRSGALVIDFGTSLPESTQRIGEALDAAGARYMDAPLGRTPAHAKEGKLNIMAAGQASDYAEIESVLKDLGENVFHVGPSGTGHTIKLINNCFGMTIATAMSEAFAMADLAGLPRKTLYEVMSAGPLHSGMMDMVKANAVDGVPDMLAFSIANARKDLGYYVSMADNLGAPSFISPATKQALALAMADGFGDHYVSEMVDFMAKVFTGKTKT